MVGDGLSSLPIPMTLIFPNPPSLTHGLLALRKSADILSLFFEEAIHLAGTYLLSGALRYTVKPPCITKPELIEILHFRFGVRSFPQ